jgi:hypothetical protein
LIDVEKSVPVFILVTLHKVSPDPLSNDKEVWSVVSSQFIRSPEWYLRKQQFQPVESKDVSPQLKHCAQTAQHFEPVSVGLDIIVQHPPKVLMHTNLCHVAGSSAAFCIKPVSMYSASENLV